MPVKFENTGLPEGYEFQFEVKIEGGDENEEFSLLLKEDLY